MTEEILKIQLRELLNTIRLKRKNGTVLEASGVNAARDLVVELRGEDLDRHSEEVLCAFLNAAAAVSSDSFPVQIEFAIRCDVRPPLR